ncbi:hypothetical protein Pcinc_015326 [Petrolisthes cinctipes]|uniref:G-protein coupled receptors family 1 profile domain-containing protein n=1 Tax=Petrolisthes cinctipes TaxID=88211 RepID=A0AAE1FTJ0_PETCI|nr:hypothetical protein Pcinc_015326 [Petrolisthes cinctipes]
MEGRSWLLSLSGKYGGLETIAWEMANMTLFDLVEPEVTHKVPKHWHSFPPPHPLWHPVLGTLYAIIGLFALFGNGVVLWVFCCTRSLRSGTNLLVINLAFSDLYMVISQFPILVCNCFSQTWVMGPFVCEMRVIGLYGFCGALFGTMSIIILAVIAYDRYRAILSPFGGTQLSMRRARLWLLLIWVYSGGWCALPFFGWNHCTFNYLSMDTWSRSYVVVLFLASYAVPLVVFCYAYFGIVSSVSRHDRNLKSHERAQGENVRYQNLQRRESQLNRVVFTSVLAFMIAWTPYAVVSLMGVLSFHSLLTPLAATLSALFAKVSTVYNPFIYAVSHHRYRQELGRRLPWLCCVLPMETFPTSLTSRPSSVRSDHFTIIPFLSRSSSVVSSRNEKAQADLPSPHTLVQSMTPVRIPFLIDSTK